MKRAMDILISLFSLIAFLPLFAVIGTLIRLKLGSPVFFTQIRSGKRGIPFKMVKFRTMTSERDASGALLPNAQRMTAFGNMLRATSLDELPELINIIKGDMSLVGPRPLLPEYDNLYSNKHARRLEVAPGLTGWAQVNGRSATSWNQRFDDDVWYVENQSFGLDLRILWMTFKKVVMKDGVTTPDQNTRFKGYD